MKRLYLAGPDVFHPDARALGDAKKAICTQHGLTGVFPLDGIAQTDGLSPADQGLAIADKDIDLLRSCDAAVVHLTPYPQDTVDPGSAVELGLMVGLGRPVWGYTNDPRAVEDRLTPSMRPGWMIERFGLVDNLMVEGAIRRSGGQVIRAAQRTAFEDLTTFTTCIASLAHSLLRPHT